MGRPDATGRFGEFGGRFVPESLMPACLELEAAFDTAWADPAFHAEYEELLRSYGGRPPPPTGAKKPSAQLRVRVPLQREGRHHTRAHKINNTISPAPLC